MFEKFPPRVNNHPAMLANKSAKHTKPMPARGERTTKHKAKKK